MMNVKLLLRACNKLCLGLVFIVLLLFIPAGTFEFWNAWLFIVALFVPTTIVILLLWIRAPDLLSKRLLIRENEPSQKYVVVLSAVIFVIGFVIAAVDFRMSWSRIPVWVIVVATMLFVFAYGMYVETLRENAYLSRIVEVQEGQKVIDVGLYSIVRHPMYLATIALYLAIPVMLGSLVALLVFFLYPALIIKRICNEEAILDKGLEGYLEYKKRVRYRLIPFIW